jgi:hypothetical protein
VRAIIIQDTDASNLLDLLKLEKFDGSTAIYNIETMEAWQSLPQNIKDAIISNVHRKFHYIVCRWLQEQGANVVR